MPPFYYKVRRKFHKFPLLPPEIRHRIWYFCLPRRIVEFDQLDSYIAQENDDDRPDDIREDNVCLSDDVQKVRTNRKPPLIMSVCREAYDVVLRHGFVDCTGKLPTWLQPRVDRMLFCHRKLNNDWYAAGYRAHPYNGSNVRRLAAIFDWSHSLKIPLAFYHFDLYPFNMDSAMMDNWERRWIIPQIAFLNEFAIRGRDRVFPCAIETFVLHITPEQAALSGLFGRLGEEICQLVDVYDTERLRQYRDLWKKTCPRRVMAKPSASLDWGFLFDEHKLHRLLDSWLGQCNRVMLAAVWKTATAHHQDDADLKNVFLPHCDTHFPIFDYHKLMEAHPWVIATRAWLPTLQPQISFRVCWDSRCMALQTDPRAYYRKTNTIPGLSKPQMCIPATHRAQRLKETAHFAWSKRLYQHKQSKTPPRIVRRAKAMRDWTFIEDQAKAPIYLFSRDFA